MTRGGPERRVKMKDLLTALRGSRLLAEGVYGRRMVRHYLMPDGRVLEVVSRK
jgi:hypothetical protein